MQDGADPPPVRRVARPRPQTDPASAARPLSPRQRQREGGLHPRAGRFGAKRGRAAGRRHHPLLGRCRRNLGVDVSVL